MTENEISKEVVDSSFKLHTEPSHKKQLKTYLKLSGKRLGLLINFGAPLIKDGIHRVVLGLPDA